MVATAPPTAPPAPPTEPPALEQLRLIPETAPLVTQERLDLGSLPPDEQLLGTPTPTLVDLVKKYGVVVPILVVRRTNGELVVAGGRRRIKAARQAKLPAIQAEVWHTDDPINHVLTLIENNVRKANEASEVDAVIGMRRAHATDDEIIAATGLPKAKLGDYTALANLRDGLFEGFRSGRIKLGVAKKAAKLPAEAQDRLADVLRATGKLTGNDVDAEIAALRDAEAQQAALDLGDLAAQPDSEESDERAFYAVLGEEVFDLIRQVNPDVTAVDPDPNRRGTLVVTFGDGPTAKVQRMRIVLTEAN